MGCDCFERLFFRMYPQKKKEYNTEEGKDLRFALCLATVVHLGLTMMCLACVGFWPMLINLMQCCSAYSCYLTLRERQVWVYMVLLIIQVLVQTLDILGIGEDKSVNKPASALQTMGNLIALSFCAVLAYFVGKAGYFFRKTGGLHGTLKDGATPLLIED